LLGSPVTTLQLPSGLAIGDKFRILFLTDTGTTATSSDAADYDDWVNTKANAPLSLINAANLSAILQASGVTWTAVVSTPTVNAFDRVGVFSTPIYRIDGTRVANNSADLWDNSLINSVRNDDLGHEHNYPVWTGTGANGLGVGFAQPLGTAFPTYGQSDYASGQWVDFGVAANTTLRSIYGLSSELTLVPEPGTVTFVSLALGMLAWRTRRRRP